jgi:hypothetical protein
MAIPMAHVVKLIRVLVLILCTALTGCVEIAAMGMVGMVENIAELGEYMTTGFDCTPPSYPDPVECVEEIHRTVTKIRVTHLVMHFPDNEIVQNDIIIGLNNVLHDKIIIVNEKNFKKDKSYWFSSKTYKTMEVESLSFSDSRSRQTYGFKIYDFKHKEGSLVIPQKYLWSLTINKWGHGHAAQPKQLPFFTILSQRLSGIITSER